MAGRTRITLAKEKEDSLDVDYNRVSKINQPTESGQIRVHDRKQEPQADRGAMAALPQILNIEPGDVDKLPRCYDNVNQRIHLSVLLSSGQLRP